MAVKGLDRVGTISGSCYNFVLYLFIFHMNIVMMELVLLVNGTLKAFDISYILTKGGPGTTTELVATYMYKTSFGMTKYGSGSAMAVFLAAESLLAVGLVRFIGGKLQKKYS